MNMGEKIKSLREKNGLTLEQVGNMVGVGKSTVRKWEVGMIANMKRDKIAALANALNTSPAYLMGWDENGNANKNIQLPAGAAPPLNTHKVPRLGRIACGTPIFAEGNIDGYDDIPDYVSADFTLVCKGDSMVNARIFDGDIVCIRQQPEVENGEIAAVLIGDEEATLKRVRLFSDHIVLEPENPMYRPMVFWEEEMNQITILGKATHFISVVR